MLAPLRVQKMKHDKSLFLPLGEGISRWNKIIKLGLEEGIVSQYSSIKYKRMRKRKKCDKFYCWHKKITPPPP